MTPPLYSAEEVAEMLGLHVRTVRGYVRDGRLPAVRIGKQYRIAAADLRAFTGAAAAPERRVEVSAIVQIEGADRRLLDRLTAHATGGQRGVHLQSAYDDARQRLTVVVLGAPDAAAAAITLLGTLAEAER